MRTRCLVALVAGVALALSFPPGHLVGLLPFAVAAFFATTAGLPARGAWLPGLVFGLGFQVTLLWWMHVLGTVPWLGLSVVQGAWYAVLAAAAVPLRRLPVAPVWLAVAWVAMENIRTDWPAGGMPWGRLAYAVAGTPASGALPYVGSTGVSLLLATSGALLASAYAASGLARLVPLATLAGLLVVTMVPRVAPYTSGASSSIEVAAVQGNVPGDGTDVLGHYRQVTHDHFAETRQLAADVAAGRTPRPAFVVWPENSTAIDPFRNAEMLDDVQSAAASVDVPLLAGVVVDGGPTHVLNQGIVFDPVTGAGERYTKRHPVPFGEYIPWRWLLGSHLPQLNQIRRDMVRGTRTAPLDIAGIRVADAICFDVAYDDGLYAQIGNGGQLVVVQTSNASFIHTAQVEQQFAISRLRAVETHRYVVVAAIDGLTGVIAPDGSLVTSIPLRTQGYVDARVELYDDVTPAVRIGPWPGRSCVVLTVLGWLVVLRLRLGRGQYRRTSRPAALAHVPSPPSDRTPA